MTIASTCASAEFGTCTSIAPVELKVTVESAVDAFDSTASPRAL
jgi:hypothetical protein